MAAPVFPVVSGGVKLQADPAAVASQEFILGLDPIGGLETKTTTWQFDPSAEQGFLFGLIARWGWEDFLWISDQLQYAVNVQYKYVMFWDYMSNKLQNIVNVQYPTAMASY